MTRKFTLAAMTIALMTSAARAQIPVPSPVVADTAQRSGLFTRHIPVTPTLPPDPKRDIWQNTRWADEHENHRINSSFNGGLYGRYKWKGDCTTCYAPSFRGAPGASTMNGPTCPPEGRLLGNMLHPFHPVSYYYSGGCYVPIYDLDAFVPGPGPWPFPRLYHRKPVGG